MKILLSAFAFAPNQGSEPGVGWRWAMELAKEHEVVVITDVTRQRLVEAPGVELPPNLQVAYFRPKWLANIALNSRTAQVLYTLWQFGLIAFARRLHATHHFDLAMHVTYSVFRHPSFLGFLGVPFIFGPLGGGEDAPWRLKQSIKGREKLKEVLRFMLNWFARIDPSLWLAYHKASIILVSTQDTKNALPFPFRDRAIVYPNLGIDAPTATKARQRETTEPLQVLFVGRLLGWKGAHLAIRAIARAREYGLALEFTLVGRGPFGKTLHRLASQLGIEEKINWIEEVSHQDMPALMQKHHCFLFPSLHDSGGTVVLEAQANGLPVICLDLGGPASLVSSDSAFVVETDGRNEADVVKALAEALSALGNDERRRRAMSVSAALHARENMSWERRVSGALKFLRDLPRTP